MKEYYSEYYIRKNNRRRYRGHKKITRAVSMLMICVLLFTMGAVGVKGIMQISYPRRYEKLVCKYCGRFDIDESLVYAVIRTESGFDPHARSNVGAMGLMQIMPETFRWLQTKLPDENGESLSDEMLYEPEINIRYGVYFLSILKSEFGNNTLTAAAYHAGRGRVNQWLSSGVIDPNGDHNDIPSDATSHYVYKVESAEKIYRRLYYDKNFFMK